MIKTPIIRSGRQPVAARNMVSTSQPLAVQAGMKMFHLGGNATDAALAAAMCLPVVEPTMNGIGGDLFAFVWSDKKLHALNSSGKSPAQWQNSDFSSFKEMPLRGWDSITVPGLVAGWMELWKRFGSLTLEQISMPAIGYAERGFPVSPITAALWAKAPNDLRAVEGFDDAFFRDGKSPIAGEIFSYPEQAKALREICMTEGESFYRGAIATLIERQAKFQGGKLTKADLASHKAEWVQPCTVKFCGYDIHEMPPNSQGLAVLIALGILQTSNAHKLDPDSFESVHACIEATKLAMADAARYLGDPNHSEHQPEKFLSSRYLGERAAQINWFEASNPGYGIPSGGGTVLVAAADETGNMISLIQSNFFGFGSGVVLKDYGISFHNRAKGFHVDESHPNGVGPSKQPFHTLIPGFVTKDGEPYMSFGLMGGSMQAQGHLQILNRILAHNWNPQAASDAPRWRIKSDREVWFEEGFDLKVIESLRNLGHECIVKSFDQFGGAQIILKIGDAYIGGSDHRKDGCAAGL